MVRNLSLVIFLVPCQLLAQTANFSIPAGVCLNEVFPLANTSSSANNYLWDFCQDGLEQLATGQDIINLSTATPAIVTPEGIKAVNDNGNWYVFVFGRDNNTLYRIDFGTSLSNPAPMLNTLGNVGGRFNLPTQIEVIKDGSNWFGMVTNFNDSKIIRLNFGGSLANAQPILTATDLGTFGTGIGPRGMDVIEYGSGFAVIISYWSNNTLTLLDFVNGLDNPPGTFFTISNSTGHLQNPVGVALQQENGKWYGLVANYSNGKILHLDFGINLFSNPIFSTLVTAAQSTDVALLKDGLKYYGFIEAPGGLIRIDFKEGLFLDGSEIINNANNYGNPSNDLFGISFVKDAAEWRSFTISQTTGKVFKIVFTDLCSSSNVTIKTSSAIVPTNLSYSQAGNYFVELTAYAPSGSANTIGKLLIVQNLPAPALDFSTSNACINQQNDFMAISQDISQINSWAWDFGDSNTSILPTPSNQYATIGKYSVTLSASAANGCSNRYSKSIDIFPAPTPAFSPPLPTKSCTLQPYLFTNASVFDPLSNPIWAWSVNGIEQSTNKNFNHAFDLPGTYSIALQAAITGCSNSFSQDFIVEEQGSLVDFTFANQCENDQTLFTNNSSGGASDYLWDFGDGQTSSQTSPTHVFPAKGNYHVQLTASNAAGCVNSFASSVAIASTPAPDFSIDLPPFSCAGTPTQFHDATPALTDSNITTWAWSFNDGTGATSMLKDPIHTYNLPGNYDVSLLVTTNFGCAASVQMPVVISASPNADFMVGPACLDKPTQLESINPQGIKSWSWIIGNSFYTLPDPVHVFKSAANYTASLSVRGFNDCEGFTEKTISVKPKPILNFVTSPACTDQQIIFTDQTTGVDRPASWLWDFGNGATAMASPASVTFTSPGAVPVSMMVTTLSGCEYALSKNVVVAPSPVASFTEATSFGPPPLQVQFTNTSTGGASVQWQFNDALSSTSTDLNPLFTFLELGDYLVELIASNSLGCSDSFSNIIKVLVPVIDLSLEALTVQAGFSGQSFIPVITVKNKSNVSVSNADVFVMGSSGAKLKTNLALNLSPGASSEVIVPIELFSRENYLCVELAAINDIERNNNSDCENLAGKPILTPPFPNPTSGTLSFGAVLEEEHPGTLTIINSLGQMVFHQTYTNLSAGMNRIELDLSGNQSGLYIGIWELNGQKSEFKFMFN